MTNDEVDVSCRWAAPARPRRGAWIGLAAIAIVLSACSDGDDAGGEPPTEPSGSTVPGEGIEAQTTPPATAATTVAPSTSEPALSATAVVEPTTDGPTTSESSRTTVPAPASTQLMSEESVADAVRQLHSAWGECARQLPNCDATAVSTEYATGELSDLLFDQATTANDAGRRAENVESRTIAVESVELDPAAGTATVVTCESDGTVVIEADGSVANDAYVSRRIVYTFAQDGERWRGATRVEQDRAEGEGNGLCAAS